jgi:hypothetical protein
MHFVAKELILKKEKSRISSKNSAWNKLILLNRLDYKKYLEHFFISECWFCGCSVCQTTRDISRWCPRFILFGCCPWPTHSLRWTPWIYIHFDFACRFIKFFLYYLPILWRQINSCLRLLALPQPYICGVELLHTVYSILALSALSSAFSACGIKLLNFSCTSPFDKVGYFPAEPSNLFSTSIKVKGRVSTWITKLHHILVVFNHPKWYTYH